MKLLFDFFPILLFFIAYKVYGIYAATAVAIIAAIVQNAAFWYKHRRFEKMHLITLALIILLGGATLIFQDKAFIMWKPSAVNWAFGLAFLLSQFIGDKTLVERMMSHAIQIKRNAWTRLNLSWVIFFLLMGFANLYVANFYFQADAALIAAAHSIIDIDSCATAQLSQTILELCNQAKEMEEQWVNFKMFGMMGLTILFVIGQAFYLARHVEPEASPDIESAEQEQSN
ncbi:MAG: septation protein IspZ [Gammaproteobacteria bacterium]|nr:septation protein IspZ [Gammaproteobacteria bacterium]